MTDVNNPQAGESQLISDYLKGDEKALETLIKKFLNPIYSFVYRHIGNAKEAEDITQEIFIKCWKNLKKFDYSKNFKTWIFSIAKNASIDFLRKKKNINFSDLEGVDEEKEWSDNIKDSAPLPDEIFEKKNLAEILHNAINKLPVKYRMVLFLHYNDHFNFREISETLEESINTVKSRHLRGVKMLKGILEGQGLEN
jgi:RNA polymerase sigma-70 factor, ECF subfamily